MIVDDLLKLPRSQIYAQLWIGRVSSVDKTRHTAQVQFSEQDGFISFDLQVLVTRDGDYSLPSPNVPVACLILDGRLGVGFVLGSFYTESDAAPLSDASQRAIVGDDIRLGTADASNKIALAGKSNDGLSALWSLFNSVFGDSSAAIVTPAPGAPDPVYVAVKGAIAVLEYEQKLPPSDVSSQNVSAK